ncbi:lactococcin 972 family bacteriocin [Actinomyces ruminicola]|uniref:Bacteriocin, lactococcin 972 family n=1 Tax=Actinomyces ruminicola TaxID=332524 RepID=A0A1H0ABE2_9ACTO|nr:bacteriocin, lactococcin 972 family [Actinomyces ruminicola]
MPKIKRPLTLFAATLLALSVAAPASAAISVTYPREGGTWRHGITNGQVLSSYGHPSKWHHATAVGARTKRASARPGVFATAVVSKAIMNNQTYYGVDE